MVEESERKNIKSDRLSRFEENEWNEHTKLKCWNTSTGVQKMAQDGKISMNAERMRQRVEKRMSEIIIFWYSKSDFKWMRVYFLWVFLISLYFSIQRRQTKKKTRKRVWQTNCIRGTHKTVSPAQKIAIQMTEEIPENKTRCLKWRYSWLSFGAIYLS